MEVFDEDFLTDLGVDCAGEHVVVEGMNSPVGEDTAVVVVETALPAEEVMALVEETKPVESAAAAAFPGQEEVGSGVSEPMTPEMTSSALLLLLACATMEEEEEEAEVAEQAEVADADGWGMEITSFVPSAFLITGCVLRLFSCDEASLVLAGEILGWAD